MKNMIYSAEIIDLTPSTVDGEDARIVTDGTIIDGYAEVRLESGIQFWAFAEEDWRVSRWSLSLTGKTVPLWFFFLNIETKLSEEKIKEILPLPKRKKPCDYTIIGEIINKEPSPKLPDKYERFQVDCGFILNGLSADKGAYNIGDYVRSEGRLDAYLVEEEKLAKRKDEL